MLAFIRIGSGVESCFINHLLSDSHAASMEGLLREFENPGISYRNAGRELVQGAGCAWATVQDGLVDDAGTAVSPCRESSPKA